MSFRLREYQMDIITQVRKHLRAGERRILVQAPTGAGKTALTAFMLGSAHSKGRRSIFTVHRRELVKQSARTFTDAGVPYGFIAAGFPTNRWARIQIASIDSLRGRKNVPEPDLIVVDECHHAVARSWAKVLARFPNAAIIGLTATPERLDGRGLGEHFDVMIEGPTTRWLIDNGFLAPFRYFAPKPQFDDIATRAGDFDRGQAAKAMDKPRITGDAVEHYTRIAPGKRAVVFACNIKHSMHIAEQFRQAGFAAEHVDGDTPTEQRDKAIEDFAAGRLQILTNVDLFGEGFDLPQLEVSILLRPTQSLGLWLQQVGRALRTAPGKEEAIILDHAGNIERFGMPDDPRTWSLSQGKRAKKDDAGGLASIRTCPKCFAANRPGRPRCAECGAEFPVQAREVEEAPGELVELTREARQELAEGQLREMNQCMTLEEMVALGHRRGYVEPEKWARYIIAQRNKRRAGAGSNSSSKARFSVAPDGTARQLTP